MQTDDGDSPGTKLGPGPAAARGTTAHGDAIPPGDAARPRGAAPDSSTAPLDPAQTQLLLQQQQEQQQQQALLSYLVQAQAQAQAQRAEGEDPATAAARAILALLGPSLIAAAAHQLHHPHTMVPPGLAGGQLVLPNLPLQQLQYRTQQPSGLLVHPGASLLAAHAAEVASGFGNYQSPPSEQHEVSRSKEAMVHLAALSGIMLATCPVDADWSAFCTATEPRANLSTLSVVSTPRLLA